MEMNNTNAETYMDQSVRTTRSSTMARLHNQLQSVGKSMQNMKKVIIVSTVLTAAFAGAVFGLVIAANDMSKDTVPHNNILTDKITKKPIQISGIENVKALGDMSLNELKKVQEIEFETNSGWNCILKVNGLMYNQENMDELIFLTNEGKFGLGENGVLSPLVEEFEEFSNEFSSRSLLAGNDDDDCEYIKSPWSRYGYWNPTGCNEADDETGSTANPSSEPTNNPNLGTSSLDDFSESGTLSAMG